MQRMCPQPSQAVRSHARSVPVSALVVTVARAPIVQTKVNARNVRHVTCSLPRKKRTQNRAAPTLPPPQRHWSASKHLLRLPLLHRHLLLCRRLRHRFWSKLLQQQLRPGRYQQLLRHL